MFKTFPTASVRSSARTEDYGEKLLEFVPVEVLSGFLVLSAAAHNNGVLLIAALVAGLIATPAYLFLAGQRQLREPKMPHSYVLAVIAFTAWALGTNVEVANLFRLDQKVAYWILAAAVFLLPAIDGVLRKKLEW